MAKDKHRPLSGQRRWSGCFLPYIQKTKTSATCRLGQTLQTREASCLLDSWNSAPLYLRVIRPLVESEMNETGQEKMVAV